MINLSLRELSAALERSVDAIGRTVAVMHVCGSHEQAIARLGLRATLPRNLNVIMGPGCPVCITDMPEIDEGVALALQGVRIATYGDMIRVPGSAGSLADARAAGACGRGHDLHRAGDEHRPIGGIGRHDDAWAGV